MEFAIATCELWSEYGYNIKRWRKSVDGTKALVHLEYAEILVPDIASDPEIVVYSYFDPEFEVLLNSPEWNPEIPEPIAEENNDTPIEG